MPRERILLGLGALIIGLCLSSCFYPEAFDIKLNIDPNGAYSFVFDGTLVFLYENQTPGLSLRNDQDPQEIQRLEQILKSDKSFQEVKYLGQGRFKVLYRREGVIQPDSKIEFLSDICRLLTIESAEDGEVLIQGANWEKKTMADLEKLHVKLEGKLRLTTNARVIRDNADRSPWFFERLGAYEWRFDLSPFPPPWMLLKLQER